MSTRSAIKTPGQSLEGNAYEICHLAVARARQIQKGTSSLVATGFQKPTSQALEELAEGKVRAYTDEEWAEEVERRAAEVPAPLDEVLEIERPPSPEVVEEVGGFSGFLNAVMKAEGSAAKRSSPEGDEGENEDLDEEPLTEVEEESNEE
jgi:DNA-directed RNA polymerase omega subunit